MLTQSANFIATNAISPPGFNAVATYVWDTGSLSWVRATQAGGGGGGGAVTIADGADVTQGALADAAITTNAAGSVSGKLRGLVAILSSVWDSINSRLNVAVQNTVTVAGTVNAVQSGAWTVAATQSGVWSVGRTWALASGTDSVTVTGTVAATQSGAWSTGRTWTLSSGTDSVAVTGTVGVSGTVTVAGTVSTKTDLAPASPAAVSVGVASTALVASNANRRGLVLVNTSTARVSLGFGVAAVLDAGITLYPGDSFSMDEYSFDTGAINAIASAAASNVGVQEFNA